jgi:hypothetical protein
MIRSIPSLGALLSAALLLGLATSCLGGKDETGDQPEDDCNCGDPDGDGSDTGDIPGMWGEWTTTFGYQLFHETCGITDLTPESENWINNSAMTIGGYGPDGWYAYFDDNDDEMYYGVVSSHGSVSFSGRHMRRDGYEAHVAFGGLVFYDEYRGRDVIEGFGYMGIDLTGDGNIECEARGEFTARKSGN